MNKTIVLVLLFLLLGGGTWYMVKNQDTSSSISVKPDGQFAVKNEKDIYKIFIAERSGKTTTLERKNGYWLYNGKDKARPNVMERLLEVVTKVQMYYTTPRAAEKNMLNNLATNGIKVEVYGKENNLLKSYYVGGSTADGYGTFMIMENAKEPYITHIPNFEGTLRGRYSMKVDDWKDRTIFAERVDDIQSVSVEYPKQKNRSFKIQKEGNDFEVLPFFEATPKITKPVSKAKVEKYLLGYKMLMAEDFENNNPKKDSINSMLPFAIVSLTNTKGETTAAIFHPQVKRDANGNLISHKPSKTRSKDTHFRYFVDCNDGSFRLAQHRVFGEIFWGYDQFFGN